MNKILAVLFILLGMKASSQNGEALAIADSLFAVGNYYKAIGYYKQTEGHLFKIAKSYESLGNNKAALDYYEQALNKNKNAQIATYNYGKLLLKTRQHRKADSVFEQLEQLNPTNPSFSYYLGLSKEQQKDSTALLYYKKALAIDANHQNTLYRLAKILTEKRAFEQALKQIDLGLKTQPNSERFLNLQALSFFHTDHYHQATITYQKLKDLGVSNARLHENLGVSFSRTMRFEAAIKEYTILINQYDDLQPKWHFQIAHAYMALRYFDKAKRHLEIALVLKSPSKEAEYSALSTIYAREKLYKKQMEVLKKLIEENPKSEQAYYLLATAADNYFKDDEVVIRYYEKYIKRFGEKGRYTKLAQQRIKDLKTQVHFTKD